MNKACRGFLDYITGGKPPPQAPSQPFCPHPQSRLKKWNLVGRLDIVVTELCFVIIMSCLLSANDAMFKKHCVVNVP